jgi:hypothetical protein
VWSYLSRTLIAFHRWITGREPRHVLQELLFVSTSVRRGRPPAGVSNDVDGEYCRCDLSSGYDADGGYGPRFRRRAFIPRHR